MAMTADDIPNPIGSDEVARLFAPLHQEPSGDPIALAVSGGSDSTALMVLFADWLQREGVPAGRHLVLTVDHGLRADSGVEAQQVAAQASRLGFRHATLIWEGEKPSTGVQAAARKARYRLMRDHLAAHGIGTLLTAHTRDDQAETLLMRLARGSGLDGLAGIAPSVDLPPGPGGAALRVLRPLLGMPKARLMATLRERGLGWSEDPSNLSQAYERPRLRAAQAALEAVGLTSAMLASSAGRLRRVRTAIDAMTDAVCAEDRNLVRTHPCGFFRIDRPALKRLPDEIALRVIGRCIAAAGGAAEPVSLAKLELLVAGVQGRDRVWQGHRTLARAHVVVEGGFIQIEREPGRVPLPALLLTGGASVLWDGRFVVEIAPGLEGSLEVGALGVVGMGEFERPGGPVIRSRPLQFVPAFRRQGRLVAVPCMDFWGEPGLERLISAAFVGLRYNLARAGDWTPDGPESASEEV
jgi:tRNA(Ile)-lysidine synthase